MTEIRRRLILFILFTGSVLLTAAQTPDSIPSKKKKLRFSTIAQTGIGSGEAGMEGLIQSINGIQYGSWFLGAGIGIDNYYFRSIPLFADLRKDFLKRKQFTTFIYADAGTHLPWVADSDKKEGFDHHFEGKLYLDLGLGARLPLKKGHGLLITAGYSYKQIRHTMEQTFTTDTYVNWNTLINRYELNRLSFKIGWQL